MLNSTTVREQSTLESIKEYYGRVLSSSADLKTSACCSTESLPPAVSEILQDIHPEVKERFYGCGNPFPPALLGRSVLDLGCGAGRDSFLLSKLVGPSGHVTGIDMTPEQLAVAEKHIAYHTDKFGYKRANVRFLNGYIEDLRAVGIDDNSMDLVVSNCVTNLSPNKHRLFKEVFRVLKPGGELYFSDVFSDCRVPAELADDPVLRGECLGGAMYTEDFRRLICEIGCADFRSLVKTKIQLRNVEIEKQVGMIGFYSITFRAFKLNFEDRCEDFGQVAYYNGTIEGHRHSFTLDDHHTFFTAKPMLVCGNTADMVSKTAYAKHFTVMGEKKVHMGLFDCGPVPTASGSNASDAPGACC